MRRYFENILIRIRTFVDQRKVLLLVVQSRDEHGLVVVRQLESLAEVSPHFFWQFTEAFADAESYTASLAEAFQKRVNLIDEKLAAKGAPSWPPLPEVAFDGGAAPSLRLRALTLYARDRIPDLEAANLVLALLPSQVADPLTYRLFLRAFIAYDRAAPWCHHVRIVAREPTGITSDGLTSHLRAELALESFPTTEVLPVDLGPAEIHAALKEEIDDESAPIPQRAQSLLIDANVDVSHGRYAEAGEKLNALIEYYEGLEPPMHAASLNALGEAQRGAAGFAKAVPTFEAALEAAMRAHCLPIMLNVCLNLAGGYFANKQWTEAAEYLDTADTIAAATLNAEIKLQCLERLGICHAERESYADARRAWLGGCELARFAKDSGALRRFLGRLRDLYAAARMHDELRGIEQEISATD